jgi:flagellin-specific chaperone FliS
MFGSKEKKIEKLKNKISKLENIITALMVSIISKDKKRMNEALESAEYFALELTANEIELAKSYVVKILNHIRKINGLAPMGNK